MELTSDTARSKRQRIARLIFIVAMFAIVLQLLRTAPRNVTVELRWDGVTAMRLRRITLTYRVAGQVARHAEFSFATPAEMQRHEARLPPGICDLEIVVEYLDHRRTLSHSFEVSDGIDVRVDIPRS